MCWAGLCRLSSGWESGAPPTSVGADCIVALGATDRGDTEPPGNSCADNPYTIWGESIGGPLLCGASMVAGGGERESGMGGMSAEAASSGGLL